jgi:hypothetical protein
VNPGHLRLRFGCQTTQLDLIHINRIRLPSEKQAVLFGINQSTIQSPQNGYNRVKLCNFPQASAFV